MDFISQLFIHHPPPLPGLHLLTGAACSPILACHLALWVTSRLPCTLQVLPCNQQEIVLVVKPSHPLDSQEPVDIQTLRTIPFISLRSSYAALAIQPLLQDALSWDALHSRMVIICIIPSRDPLPSRPICVNSSGAQILKTYQLKPLNANAARFELISGQPAGKSAVQELLGALAVHQW